MSEKYKKKDRLVSALGFLYVGLIMILVFVQNFTERIMLFAIYTIGVIIAYLIYALLIRKYL